MKITDKGDYVIVEFSEKHDKVIPLPRIKKYVVYVFPEDKEDENSKNRGENETAKEKKE